jgi:hypothetical protein
MLQGTPRRLVLAAVLFICAVGVALAQAEKVYVTRTGEKYHRGSCTSLRSSKIEMSLAEAAARYGACKVCRPPVPAVPSQPAAVEQRPSSPASAAPAPASPAPAQRSTRCQATTKKGTQCSRSAQAGRSYCWQHGG